MIWRLIFIFARRTWDLERNTNNTPKQRVPLITSSQRFLAGKVSNERYISDLIGKKTLF